MPPDIDTGLPDLGDTPEMPRLLEAVSKLTPEQKARLLERAGVRSELIPTYPMGPPAEDEEPE
ncbi:MAG TPA: hypothetical protein VK539_32075 [Myxococcaceae bacterium]|nr:hypothetical protein [Myxococcaceae bacterium]